MVGLQGRLSTSPARIALVAVIVIVILTNIATTVFAQAAVLTPGQGLQMEGCNWTLSKYWETNWGWLYIEFEGNRCYGTDSEEGYGIELYATVTLNGTYLPSQTLTCRVTNVGTEGGSVDTPYGTSYTVDHNNPDCVGHSTLVYGSDPTHPFTVHEDIYNANSTAASGAATAGAYWTGVGQDVFYSTLRTPTGGDSWVFPHPNPVPGTVGQWDPATNQIWLNITHNTLSAAQWAWVTAHELGHAIGFGHSSSSDYSKTIMMGQGTASTGLQPRTLEKCAAVEAFPVDIKIGD
jgi:hypothetical protein